jgi:hypothetical protein
MEPGGQIDAQLSPDSSCLGVIVAYNFPLARSWISGPLVVVDRSRGDAECTRRW